MRRRKAILTAAGPDPGSPSPLVLHPDAVFSLEQARRALGMEKSTLAREIRLGRLRVSKRGKRYLFLGSWLREWIADGVVTPRPRKAAEKN